MRAPLLPMLLLAAATGLQSSPGQTVLTVAPAASNQFVLSWSSGAANFALQSATNLASPDWTWVTDALPAAYPAQTSVTVSNCGSARFFRLAQLPGATPDGMALVPAGWFVIGDSLDGEWEAVPTNVYVSAFYMDTNLVSLGQWQGVFSYATNHGYGFDWAGSGKGPDHPLIKSDWYDMVKWCNARSQQAGLAPVYFIDPALTQLYTIGEYDLVYAAWTANGYRLPTEAEWEKAARGGLSGKRFPWGDTVSESQANYEGDIAGYSYDLGPDGYNAIGQIGGSPCTTPVGCFPPNGYGLCDMAGNVAEFCWDWYDYQLSPGSPYAGGVNPRGPASSPFVERVMRGGVWDFYAIFLRTACRIYEYPDQPLLDVGFRTVRGVTGSAAATSH